MKKLIILCLLVLSNSSFSQRDSTISNDYKGSFTEIFFGRLPSAKTEAMGKILVLNFDPYFVSQSNPANLVSTKGVAVFYAYSLPFYGYSDATYNYAGVSYNNPKMGALAFNFLVFTSGSTILFPGMINPLDTYSEEIRYLYTLTYSNSIKDWFSFGFSGNLFVHYSRVEPIVGIGQVPSEQTFSSTFFELGLSKNLSLADESQIKDELTFDTQLKNIFNQSPDEFVYEPFPVIL